MKTIVIGVGNPILSDDGVGLHVVEEIKKKGLDVPDVTVETAYTGGLNLLDMIRGYEKVVLVDAVVEERETPGKVERFMVNEAACLHSGNPHDVSLAEALALARNLGETQLPREIVVIGVGIHRAVDFGERLSPEVADAVPVAVRMVLSEVNHP